MVVTFQMITPLKHAKGYGICVWILLQREKLLFLSILSSSLIPITSKKEPMCKTLIQNALY